MSEEKIEAPSAEARMKRATAIGSGERERPKAVVIPGRTFGSIADEAQRKIAALEADLKKAKQSTMDELTATLSSPTRKRNEAVEVLRKGYDTKLSQLRHEEEAQVRSATDRIRNSFRVMRDTESSAYEAAKVALHHEHSAVLKEAEVKLVAGTEAAAKIFVTKRDEVLAWKAQQEAELRAAEKTAKVEETAVTP